jgi:hypothetical protein
VLLLHGLQLLRVLLLPLVRALLLLRLLPQPGVQ